jgi:Zn-dependent protease with chaperone function
MHHHSVLIAFLASANAALAHEGHGLEGAHSHPSDAWGFLMLGLVVGLALWFSRKK